MNLDFDIFKVDPDSVVIEQGTILISEPFSNDSYFRRSVVLLTEHNEEGTIGFILNKPIEAKISEFIDDFPDTESKIFIGGPVSSNTIHFLHTVGDQIPNSVKVFNNIYWGGDFDSLKSLIQLELISPDQILFFVGYSGWSPDQLWNEVKENYWTVANLNEDEIMSNQKDDLWKTTLDKLGGKFKIWGNSPENPELN